MKTIIIFLLLTMSTVFSAEAHKYRNDHKNANISISLQTFYDELSPYGDWMYTADYGYVWRPYFDNPEAFRPYSSNGNWVNTEYGWTWVSDYRWGWAAFHYGRWDFDNYLGWMWIPGYEWAPAWVSWGNYGDYYGWAPLGPKVYVSMNSNWFAPDIWWTFVPRHRFCSDNWTRYIYDRPVHVTNITHITNVYVNRDNRSNNSWYYGPRVSEVERYNKVRVRTLDVVESRRSDQAGVNSNRLSIYRPEVENKRNEARPTEYRNIEQARRGSSTLSTNARLNNPGDNRTRANRVEAGSSNQVSSQRETNESRGNKIEPRMTSQTPNSGNTQESREIRVNPRTANQSDVHERSANSDSRVASRRESQGEDVRIVQQPKAESRNETQVRDRKTQVYERSNTQQKPSRAETPVNYEPRSSNPSRENVNAPSSRESENRSTPATQPSREPRTQSVTPAVRNENTERRQSTPEVNRRSETEKAGEVPQRGSTGNPAKR